MRSCRVNSVNSVSHIINEIYYLLDYLPFTPLPLLRLFLSLSRLVFLGPSFSSAESPRLRNCEPDLGRDLGDGADCLLFMLEQVVGMVDGVGMHHWGG